MKGRPPPTREHEVVYSIRQARAKTTATRPEFRQVRVFYRLDVDEFGVVVWRRTRTHIIRPGQTQPDHCLCENSFYKLLDIVHSGYVVSTGWLRVFQAKGLLARQPEYVLDAIAMRVMLADTWSKWSPH